MIRTTRLKRSAACFMAVVLTALCFTVFLHSPQVNAEGEDDAKQTAEASQTAIEEYELSGRNVGVQMGTIGERELAPYEESSRSKVEHFYTSADAVKALNDKQVDCIVLDDKTMNALAEENAGLSIVKKPFSEKKYNYIVKKENKELLDKVNKAIKKLTEDKTIESIVNNYVGLDSEKGRTPYKKKNVERTGTITLAITSATKPNAYIDNGAYTGIDVDVMQAVCDELKTELVVSDMQPDSLVDSITWSMADIAAVTASGIIIKDSVKAELQGTAVYTTSKQVIALYTEPEKADPEESSKETSGEESGTEDAYDFTGKTIGVQLGTTGDIYATDYETDGTARVERYSKAADAIQALKQQKIDCVILDEQPAKNFVQKNENIRILEKEFTLEDYAMCVKKGNKELLDKVNAALKKIREDGTLQKIIDNYIGTDDTVGKTPYQKKDVERKGTLTVATNAEFPPYEFVSNGQITGIDMDMVQAIADELGMELKIENMKFDSIIASVNAGKADIGAAGMTVTEDRQKNIDFSESYTTSKQVIIVYDDTPKSDEIKGVADLIGKTIGVQLGTTGDIYATDYETDGTARVERYSKAADAIQALKQQKIDCVILDEQPAKNFVQKNENIRILEKEFTLEDYAMCVKKGNKELLDKVNAALKKIREDGTLQKIIDNYIGTDDTVGKTPYQKKDVERKGTLTVATNAEFPPYEFVSNGQITGIDMDMVQAIADELGMELKIENMKFDSIIASVNAGKADIGAAGMTVTEDRLKNIDFSESYTTSKQVIIVYDSQASSASLSFGEKLKQNFIDEDRWRYLVDGLGTTLLITALSILVGLFMGTLIAVVRTVHDQNGKLKILNFICKLYLTVIRGTPAVLQLLIIYYGVFGAVNINKIIVAVVAFGLNSAAYVAEVIRSGINAVDKGQFEAGRCLGLTYKQTMSSIIMPQAFKNMLPALLNEVIALLKETAICGYIALQDLTMGGDIIRSQTFDAFLPLIAVAIIYLIIVVILTRIVTILERRLKKSER